MSPTLLLVFRAAGLVAFTFSPMLLADPRATAPIHGDLHRPAMSFEENLGQAPSSTRFVSRGAGYTVEFAPQSVRIHAGRSTVTMRMLGSNAAAAIEGVEAQPGITNYLFGSDPKKWITHVPHYGQVRYRDVYPAIDLVFHGNGRQLEYDWLVRPGGDPRQIRTRFQGVRKMQVDANNDLVLNLGNAEMKWRKPVVYQETGGVKAPLEGGFAIAGKNLVEFAIRDYDRGKPLVIDPILEYATFLGGSGTDVAFSLWVDSGGDAYAAGYTSSSNFPQRSGRFANYNSVGFITKINPTGTQNLATTFIAGSDAVTKSLNVSVTAITGDSSGSIYVGGIGSGSTNAIPFTSNAFQKTLNGTQNGWVAKLPPDLSSIQYCSWLGGNTMDGVADGTNGIAVDSAKNLYVAGYTNSSAQSSSNPTGFYVTTNAIQTQNNGGQDVFLVKIDPTGSTILYSTFIGGSSDDHPFGVGVGPNQQMYVTGYTRSCDYPVMNAYQPAHAGGYTDQSGTLHPCTDGVNNNADVFVTVVKADGSGYVYSTYLGGDNEDRGRAIYVDAEGDAFITGDTESPSHEPPYNCSALKCAPFPTKNAFQPKAARCNTPIPGSPGYFQCVGGDADAFITELDPTGNLLYSTYYGGTLGVDAAESADHVAGCSSTPSPGCGSDKGLGIVVQETGTDAGSIYVAGSTTSTDFPLANAQQAHNAGGFDSFVVKIKADGTGPLFSTYFGGAGDDYAYALGRDGPFSDGSFNIFAAGWATPPANSSTTFFPDNPQLLYPYAGGSFDAFLFELANAHISVIPREYFFLAAPDSETSPGWGITTGVQNGDQNGSGQNSGDQTGADGTTSTTSSDGSGPFTGCQTSQGTCSTNGSTCTAQFGTVAPGATATYTCFGQFPPTTGGQVGTTSTGQSNTNDPDPSDPDKTSSGGFTVQPGNGGTCVPSVSSQTTSFTPSGGMGSFSVSSPCGLQWTLTNPVDWISAPASGAGGTTMFNVLANPTFATRSTTLTIAGQPLLITQTGLTPTGLEFYPVTPCRVADTRATSGFSGAFGPPSMGPPPVSPRSFPISGSCGIPAAASAYSLNVTVVPQGYLGYLSIWPTGEAQPVVSTLNSFLGTVVSNAAIVPAGSGGAISIYVTNATDVVIDTNGYFAP
jgi:hypothetical protein